MSLLIEKILKLISYSRSSSKPKDGYNILLVVYLINQNIKSQKKREHELK
jgi:hypothetical protein